MTHRKNIKSYKSNSNHLQTKKHDHDISDDKLRVIQKNLVFVSGLPPFLYDPETLKKEDFFSHYGKVNKIIVKPVSSCRKICSYQAYITYESQLEASIAIVVDVFLTQALDGYKIDNKPLKVSYGTTKYCSYFLRGLECKNPNCFFLHKIQKEKEVTNGETKNLFEQQNDAALQVVTMNLPYIMQKIKWKNIQAGNGVFPSLSQMVDFLLEKGIVSKEKTLFIDKSQKENDRRPVYFETQKEKKNLRPSQFVEFSPQREKSETYFDKEEKLEGEDDQKEVSLAETRQFDIEERIQKMIIRKLFRNSTKHKSKMNFVKTDKTFTEQLKKLRGIVQQYLITNN